VRSQAELGNEKYLDIRGARSLSDEIAEFLRRAAQRRAEQMQQQQRAAQQQYASPPPAPPLRPVAPVVVEAEIVDDDDLTPVRSPLSKVAQHVAKHLDTREFAQRAERLADTTEQTDERMESHLHQAFDHRLGNISAGTQSITAAATPAADDEVRARVAQSHPLLSMLRQPQSVRNAIIISELLQRPMHNW
jgi:hypothetical protein